MNTTADQLSLDTLIDVTPEQIRQFREDGFIKLKHILTPDELRHYGDAITDHVMANNPHKDRPLEERDTYGKAFIQLGRIWENSAVGRELTLSKRLGKIATDLMGTRGVRLYHDQALYKEPAGGFTPWHVDQQYWPLATSQTVTAWIPLQATPIDMGPLEFGKGSHLKNIGRDLEIGEDSERRIRDAIKEHGVVSSFEPYDLGEVSFHYGWTLHRAGGNTTDQPRKVHTIIYMDRDMTLLDPKTENRKRDAASWCPGVQPGEIVDSPLNPVIFDYDA
ncbi:MAG: phytanoyl-CoA dioxygenase family protein [Planctomycetota bacterium]